MAHDAQEIWELMYQKNEELALKNYRLLGQKISEDRQLLEGNQILNELNVKKKNDKILDAGCGPLGKIVIPAAKRGIKVSGIDISPTAIFLLQKRLDDLDIKNKCHLFLGDINSLPFQSASFDKVICINTLLHISTFDNAISELHRVTKNGGVLYLTGIKNKQSLSNRFHDITEKVIRKIGFKRVIIYLRTIEEVKKIFNMNNLKIIKTFSLSSSFPFYLDIPYPAGFQRKYVYKKLEGFDSSAHTWDFILKK